MGYQEPQTQRVSGTAPGYTGGEPKDTQQWIRERFGEPTHSMRRMKPRERNRLRDKYGEGNPEIEDLLHHAPTMTESDVIQYLHDKSTTGIGWEDWATKHNAGF